MNKLNIIVLVLTGVILTLFTFWVMVEHPYAPKQILITDANYTLVNEDIESPKPVKITLPENKVEPQPSPKTNQKQKQPQQLQKQQKKPAVKKQTPTKPVEVKTQKQQVKKNTVKKTQTVSKAPVNKPAAKKTTVKEVQKTTPTKIVTQKPIAPAQQDVLTEKEEVIAWNNWRSQLQNQVMRDTKIGAPMGTQFKFSFTVDKFGNMSNVQVWSQNPVYTDLGERVITPVLMSYQHQPILNFPQGTKRVITSVTGGFYIATNTQYSSSKDYSDFEKVKRAN